MAFKLYQKEHAIFTFDDYGALMDEVKRIGATTVLEFGPGNSTLAFIEAGCHVTTLEHDPKYMDIARKRLRGGQFGDQVTLMPYVNSAVIDVPDLAAARFDLIFVDSPVGTEASIAKRFPGQENCSRLNTLLWSISRAPVVLLHDAKRKGEQATLARIKDLCSAVEMINTVKGIARCVPLT